MLQHRLLKKYFFELSNNLLLVKNKSNLNTVTSKNIQVIRNDILITYLNCMVLKIYKTY